MMINYVFIYFSTVQIYMIFNIFTWVFVHMTQLPVVDPDLEIRGGGGGGGGQFCFACPAGFLPLICEFFFFT